ncbi:MULTISPECIES: RNase adapter RapZ [unclassified Pseudactinotalea]|uniref:RNase adapter RapZ n=1 Tax=unclassified Pseudactinotalea TaxID=2649176 RepID=UPI00128DD5D1|nr:MULTISPECIES: RNase adapter RapZ [unclassified Pseudactinotalea]MPV49969.1 RNase adapter RapZ [Pseudactinotalea sp. HY160]QGH69230.1 RNase adapter RapZ [Pseudactinotalea sp. HY158]
MTAPSDPSNPLTVPTGVPVLEQQAAPVPDVRPEIIIITGMSGAGRSRAAAVLEDLDWYVVDNLPPKLLAVLSGMMSQGSGGVHRLAAVVDVRSGQFFEDLVGALADLRSQNIDYRIVFLDADDSELVRRYESNRRPHPLQGQGRMLDGITHERTLLAHLRTRADVTIDTTDLSVHDLARMVRDVVAGETDRALRINVVSFGFKYGLPLDADHVVDVRFISNPYWVTELRNLTGKDAPVRDYVLGRSGVEVFIERYVELLAGVLDGYVHEQKPYVTIAVGCTGGKHRSVAITEAIAAGLRAAGQSVRTLHRDLGRE